ncbi:DUF2157 domain-containing protein [Exiguobacterium antarcticum]|uniref:DUF2157 domain-containing protein n=1 Tax=Exiguobacterium antarcticum TaxID=132920 RepID=A0ABT6R1K7_9BACL|nr:DUF2157 domain-containing protein [Exiguobacterium antarcticum]AFS69374.1 membrane protein-like protein [Exiguobacterium antarcticum B7]MDI3234831.1 DUF2157 domain-containing protein [Exiguobacterium antarcticum]
MARLTKLMEWQQAGLIDAETIERIKDYETHRQKKQRVPLLLIIGLTFVGLALLSFLAANWQVIPALIKIGLVLVIMVSCYVFADLSERRAIWNPVTFRILGLVAFVGALIVTVQSFHMSMQGSFIGWAVFVAALAHFFTWRHTAYAVFAFIASLNILTAGGGFGSEQATFLDWTSIVFLVLVSLAWFYFSQSLPSLVFSWLVLYFSGLELFVLVSYDGVLWPIWTLFILVPLLLVVKHDVHRQFLYHLYLVVAAINSLVYLTVRAETTNASIPWGEAIVLAVFGVAIGYLIYQKFRPLLWLLPLGLFGLLWFDEQAILIAALVEIIAFVYLIEQERRGHRLTIAFVYFIAVQLTIYFIYAWDRLDMSLFFLVGALLVFFVAGVLWWVRKRREGGVPS